MQLQMHSHVIPEYVDCRGLDTMSGPAFQFLFFRRMKKAVSIMSKMTAVPPSTLPTVAAVLLLRPPPLELPLPLLSLLSVSLEESELSLLLPVSYGCEGFVVRDSKYPVGQVCAIDSVTYGETNHRLRCSRNPTLHKPRRSRSWLHSRTTFQLRLSETFV